MGITLKSLRSLLVYKNYYLIVAASVLIRLVFLTLQSGFWYFGDSFCYLLPKLLTNPIYTSGCPSHPLAIGWVWKIGSFGLMTENSVVLFQSALSIISILFLYDLIKTYGSEDFAFTVSLLWSIFPLGLIFERTLMTESVSTSLLIILLWVVHKILLTKMSQQRIICLFSAAGILGILAVVRPQLEFSAAFVFLVLLVLFYKKNRDFASSKLIRRLTIPLLIIASVICIYPVNAMASYNKRVFNTYSLDPSSGSFVFARWLPLINCEQKPYFTPVTSSAVAYACGKKFPSNPGISLQDAIFSSPLDPLSVTATFQPPGVDKLLGKTESQLISLTMTAVLTHPLQVTQQVGISIIHQLFYAPVRDTYDYTNGSNLFFKPLPNSMQTWFNGETSRKYSSLPYFARIVNITYRWPQYMLLFTIFLWVRREYLRMRTKTLKRIYNPMRIFDDAKKTLTLVCWSFISLPIMATALTDFSNFRLFLNLVPAMTVLGVLLSEETKTITIV